MKREPVAPLEFSAVVIYCSLVECDAAERRQWRISEWWHMSGSESVGECAGQTSRHVLTHHRARFLTAWMGGGAKHPRPCTLSTYGAHLLIPPHTGLYMKLAF